MVLARGPETYSLVSLKVLERVTERISAEEGKYKEVYYLSHKDYHI